MVSMFLGRRNLHCEAAADGREAVEAVRDKGLDYFSIVFMDKNMPHLVLFFRS